MQDKAWNAGKEYCNVDLRLYYPTYISFLFGIFFSVYLNLVVHIYSLLINVYTYVGGSMQKSFTDGKCNKKCLEDSGLQDSD